MSLFKPELVPIPEVTSDVVRLNVSFPWVDMSRIGLNVAELESLCGLAGISHLTVSTSNEDDDSSSNPVVLGMGSNGTAVGGFVKTKAKTREIKSKKRGMVKTEQYLDVTIKLNRKSLEEKVKEDPRGGIRSTEIWAEKFDHELRDAIRGIGLKHLLSPGRMETVPNLIAGGLTSVTLSSAHAPEAMLVGVGISILAMPTLMNIPTWARNTINRVIFKDKSSLSRLSFFLPFAMEIDRAAVFFLMSHIQKLVQAIEIKE